MKKDNTIGNVLSQTIFSDHSIDLAKDVVENHGNVDLLKDVPIVSYAVSLLRIKDYFRDQWLLRKMAIFIMNVSRNLVTEEDRQKAINHFFESEESSKEELNYLLIILDRYVEENKALFLALVYCSFIRGEININLLKIFAESISHFLPGDCDTLRNGEQIYDGYSNVSDSMLRLSSLGLMQKIVKIINDSSKMESGSFKEGAAILPYENGSVFKYTEIGLKLRKILFPAVAETDGIVAIDMKQTIYMM